MCNFIENGSVTRATTFYFEAWIAAFKVHDFKNTHYDFFLIFAENVKLLSQNMLWLI